MDSFIVGIADVHLGHVCLQVAVKTLPFYKDYFGIAYPLPKMDLIAIADFSAGKEQSHSQTDPFTSSPAATPTHTIEN